MTMGGKRSDAFTLVELLIVIVVIAILAALSIVAYNGVQEWGRNAALLSDTTQLHRKINVVLRWTENQHLSSLL